VPRRPNRSTETTTLLAALLQQPRSWHYGYELSRRTGLKSGTLYPLLIRLNDQGLLESKWMEPDPPGKPPRHAYKLSPSGLAFAREVAEPASAATGRKLVEAGT
jgi:DNA-binding PadR family transcriptional regulator